MTKNINIPKLTIQLPDWVPSFLANAPDLFPTPEDKMRLAIDLARENIKQQTGGPFGAAVFDFDNRLIAPGLNIVVPANCSVLHAEITAIALTQKALERYDIGDGGKHKFTLASSTEPCTMCLGAVVWSGVTGLIYGARDADARAVGFDEGPEVPNWTDELNKRGISVTPDILRPEAAAVLQDYTAIGGKIYNTGK